MHTYIHTYIHTYTHIHTHTYIHPCMHTLLEVVLSLCSDRNGWYGLALYQFLQGGLSASGGRARTHCIVCRFTLSFVREDLSSLALELQTLACYNPTPLFPGAGLWRCSSCGVSETHNHGPSPSFCTSWPNGLTFPINHRSGGHASRAMPLAFLLDPDTM